MNPGQLSIAQGNLRRAGSGRPLSDVSAVVGTGMTSNLSPMSRPVPRTIFTSYAVAWLYLAGFIAAQVAYAALSPHDQAAVLRWASTNVHNLRHHPVGSLVASAFVAQTFATAWPALIALAMFGANRVLGNWRTALVCAAGHVAGTLVSEGIVGYRVSRGLLPAASRYIIDVGPSYVVVSAIAPVTR
jgi:hypothetical protein